VERPAPTFGQHTDEILGRYLQLDAEQIARLRDSKVI
jgi:crotonobetainyl-CoA:carnitine CoA-transferase CaiB-like acyl-CoA transferase